MRGLISELDRSAAAGFLSLAMVMCGLALGHTLVVTQWQLTGAYGVVDTAVSMTIGSVGVWLVWAGLSRPENQATLMGYIGGTLIWVGFFEWSWHYFGKWLALEPVTDKGIPILMPGLLMIQATALIVIVLLVFLGSNKDTRCRMFMWFHRNFKLRPGRMTAGYQRQHSRTTAIETVFLIWFIYLCAIMINDPRLIGYDSIAAMVITVGFVVWGLYLVGKLTKIRGIGPAFRYAIPTANILWLPVEAFSRWGLYPEVWVKPFQYPVIMAGIALFFAAAAVVVFSATRADQPPDVAAAAA